MEKCHIRYLYRGKVNSFPHLIHNSRLSDMTMNIKGMNSLAHDAPICLQQIYFHLPFNNRVNNLSETLTLTMFTKKCTLHVIVKNIVRLLPLSIRVCRYIDTEYSCKYLDLETRQSMLCSDSTTQSHCFLIHIVTPWAPVVGKGKESILGAIYNHSVHWKHSDDSII